MKQRFFICLLLAGVLISYGIQYLPLGESGVSGWFAISWLVFAIVVLLGNLFAWMRSHPKHHSKNQAQNETETKQTRQAGYE